MKLTKRQLKRIIKEEKQKIITETRIRHTIRRVLNEANGGNLVKFRSVDEVMAAVADYYRDLHGEDADDFIQARSTITEFIFDDPSGVENMSKQNLGNLVYDPIKNTVSTEGGKPERLPPDLAAQAEKFYDQGRFLPAFLHLITLSDLYTVAFEPSGREIYNDE